MAKRKSAAPDWYTRNVVPDQLDLRDRMFQPSVAKAPPSILLPRIAIPVLDQRDTNACTGFALASVVNFLKRIAPEPEKKLEVSPFMLYSMARRYDEFPGSKADTGSTLRGAMKGWYKHGACRAALWDTGSVSDMPPPAGKPAHDWWLDAAKRPLGAYYRVNKSSVTDMHAALNECGILYASAVCHDGWVALAGKKFRRLEAARIPGVPASADDGGHAFVITGYTTEGFIIQNSWGRNWGYGGLAILAYDDWISNGMDCWVAQLGVVTSQHVEIAKSVSLRTDADGRVHIASDNILRDREIAPFIIDMENNGMLSGSGRFRTQESDIVALVTTHIERARAVWKKRPDEPIDIALYAHGGLTGEEDAAKCAARWIPDLYSAQIFPIFLMWETDAVSTLRNKLADVIAGLPRAAGGSLVETFDKFFTRRLERILSPLGSLFWAEMKQNAERLSAVYPAGTPGSGGDILCAHYGNHACFRQGMVRFHLIGHSAGSIVHATLAKRYIRKISAFESVSFLAPAITIDAFKNTMAPMVTNGKVRRFRSYNLTDEVEQTDQTCRPIAGYGRSLLYLVSESFEQGVRTPILGMQNYFEAEFGAHHKKFVQILSPSAESGSTSHGGFDNDLATRKSVIRFIKG